MQKGRIRQPNHSQQTHCKTFSNCTRGSDPNRVWNAAECKCTLEALLAGVSTKHAAERPMHLNRSKTRKIHCNSLRNFPLHGLSKHILWFRCSGKGEHLNLATRQNPALNQLTTNVLQKFLQLRPWFRSLAGLECRGMQMCPGGVSGRGIHQTRCRTAHASEPELNPRNSPQLIEKLFVARVKQASPLVQMQRERDASEPEQNPRNSPQLIEKLFVARFKQAQPLVQMQRKRRASEPCHKAESGSQPTHNKRVARISATTPVVQIPGGSGMPRNANVPWRCFWQGYPPNTQQNGPCI